MRIRAWAGAASFRRKRTLKECLKEAKAEVERLRKDLNEDGGSNSRQQAARERAAHERQRAVSDALAQFDELEEAREDSAKLNKKRAAKQGELRISTTDKDARVM